MGFKFKFFEFRLVISWFFLSIVRVQSMLESAWPFASLVLPVQYCDSTLAVQAAAALMQARVGGCYKISCNINVHDFINQGSSLRFHEKIQFCESNKFLSVEFWFQQHQSTCFLDGFVSCNQINSKNRREYSILQIWLDFSWEVYRNRVSVLIRTIDSINEIQRLQALLASTCTLGFDLRFYRCSACFGIWRALWASIRGEFRIWASTPCLLFYAFLCLLRTLLASPRDLAGVTSISSLGRHRQSWRGLALAAGRRLNRPLTGACLQKPCPVSPAVNESCYSLVYCSYSTNKQQYNVLL